MVGFERMTPGMAEPPEALIAAIEADESLPAAPGSGYQPLAEAVTRQVRAAILDGRLKPGSASARRRSRAASARAASRSARRCASSRSRACVTLVPHSGARVSVLDFERVHRALPHARGRRADGDRRERDRASPTSSSPSCASYAARIEDGGATTRRAGSSPTGASTSRATPRRRCRACSRSSSASGTRRSSTGARTSTRPARLDVVTLEHRLILEALERRDGGGRREPAALAHPPHAHDARPARGAVPE